MRVVPAFDLPPLLAVVVSAATLWHPYVPGPTRDDPPVVECAANFSARYAMELGLDPRAALDEVLVGFGIRSLRLPVYWDTVERERGHPKWDSIDWQMDAARSSGARVILSVGHKTPRYPEYHAPPWARSLDDADFCRALMSHVAATVRRYRDHAALEAWQVENEPLAGFAGWRFGEGCRDVTRWLPEEIRLVRSLDPARPVVLNYAEAPWMVSQLPGTLRYDSDILGISTYSRLFFRSPFYRGYIDLTRLGVLAPRPLEHEMARIRRRGRELWVTELQAEPWVAGAGGLLEAGPVEMARTMSPGQLARAWQRVQRAGVSRAYLWGVEWLILQERRGRDQDLIDLVRGLTGAALPRGATPRSRCTP